MFGINASLFDSSCSDDNIQNSPRPCIARRTALLLTLSGGASLLSSRTIISIANHSQVCRCLCYLWGYGVDTMMQDESCGLQSLSARLWKAPAACNHNAHKKYFPLSSCGTYDPSLDTPWSSNYSPSPSPQVPNPNPHLRTLAAEKCVCQVHYDGKFSMKSFCVSLPLASANARTNARLPLYHPFRMSSTPATGLLRDLIGLRGRVSGSTGSDFLLCCFLRLTRNPDTGSRCYLSALRLKKDLLRNKSKKKRGPGCDSWPHTIPMPHESRLSF